MSDSLASLRRHMMVSPQAPNPYQHPEITQSHQQQQWSQQPAHHQMPPPAAPVTWGAIQ